jgi:hypothetical protein
MFSWHDEHFSVHWFGLAVLAHQITRIAESLIRVICVIRWPMHFTEANPEQSCLIVPNRAAKLFRMAIRSQSSADRKPVGFDRPLVAKLGSRVNQTKSKQIRLLKFFAE